MLCFHFSFPSNIKTDNLTNLLPLTIELLPLTALKIRQANFSRIRSSLLCILGTVQGLVILHPF